MQVVGFEVVTSSVQEVAFPFLLFREHVLAERLKGMPQAPHDLANWCSGSDTESSRRLATSKVNSDEIMNRHKHTCM